MNTVITRAPMGVIGALAVSLFGLTLGQVGACGHDDTTGTPDSAIEDGTSATDSGVVFTDTAATDTSVVTDTGTPTDTTFSDTTVADTTVADTTPVDACDEEPFAFFCPCLANDQCSSEYCIPVDDPDVAFRCTQLCDSTCPAGWDCRGTTGGDPVFICQPPVDTICDECTTNAQCGGVADRCVTFDDGLYCGIDCQDDPTVCPTNYGCEEITNDVGQITAYQCLPVSGSCNCEPGIDYNTDVAHCGGCNNACDYPGGVPGCAGGRCFLDDCATGFVNLDGADNNGCEYACTRAGGGLDAVDGGDIPEANCTGSSCDQDCDGIDGSYSRAIFVSKTEGSSGGSGGPNDPLDTVTRGINAASNDSSRDHVYIATGTYNEQVTLVEGVSIFGGYANDGSWARNIDQFPTVITASSGTSSVRALVATNIQTTRTIVGGLTALGGNNASAGGSSYGIWVRNCSNKLEFQNVTAIGGNGGGGAVGAPGAPGSNGDTGSNGGDADADTDCPNGFGSHCDDPEKAGTGGAAGVNNCSSGRNAAGGKGGGGGCGEDGGDPHAGAGAPSPAGAPGGPRPDRSVVGNPGSDGGVGGAGSNGTGGLGAGSVSSGGFWRGDDGDDGDVGINGVGGGGGSGGGGDNNGTFTCASWGGGGGGGGSGGCGGGLGRGGRAGGGSFGLFLVDSNVKLTGCAIGSKNGGNGGMGGTGGGGGLGRNGGTFGTGYKDAENGARGGKGGNGGRGGHGGGGAGGVAYGLYLAGTSNPSCSGLSFSPSGAGGSPGLGGPSSGNAGAGGAGGERNRTSANCP